MDYAGIYRVLWSIEWQLLVFHREEWGEVNQTSLGEIATEILSVVKGLSTSQVVELALTQKAGGDRITKEYHRTKSLTDSSRRQMINILVADMTEKHG